MKADHRLERVATVVLVLAAVAIAAANVYDVFFRPGPVPVVTEPTYIDGWEALLDDAIIVGDPSADVVIVEFADLTCPYCRQFHEAFQTLPARFDDRIALAFIHLPLGRPNSTEAAVAAECAAQQGVFYEFIDVVFQGQDSIGATGWTAFAGQAGLDDVPSFDQCRSENETFPRIQRGLELSRELGLTGTPSVIINGWRYPRAPYENLSDVVAEVLAGDEPR